MRLFDVNLDLRALDSFGEFAEHYFEEDTSYTENLLDRNIRLTDRRLMHAPSLRRAVRTWLQKAFIGVSYIVYVCVAVSTIIYIFFFRGFRSELRQRERPQSSAFESVAGIGPEILTDLGSLKVGRRTSFDRFPTEKPPGIERVCAFGDSFTFGDEVKADQDYPSVLQELIGRRGFNQLEVLNFGSSWHGFHQSYLVWERIGERYGCDTVLLGPAGFQPNRDTEFNHTQLVSPYYLHSRFILDGNDVRLISVVGEDYWERFEEYFRFVPRWRYLRYDRNPPAALRSMLPPGRTAPNFFYYRSESADDEAFQTYVILLRKMARAQKQVILIHWLQGIVELANRVGEDNLSSAQALDLWSFPYRAPETHYSAWGNRLIAEQFLSVLLGDAARVPILSFSRLDEPASTQLPSRRPLGAYRRLEVRFGAAIRGVFASRRPAAEIGLEASGVQSLIAIHSPTASIVDACFVPVPTDLKDGFEATLRDASSMSARESRSIGSVRLFDFNLNLGAVETTDLECLRRGSLRLGPRFDQGERHRGPWTVEVAGTPILRTEGTLGSRILRPVHGRLRLIAAVGGRATELENMPGHGLAFLEVSDREHETIQIPIARWRRLMRTLPAPEQPPLERIGGPHSRSPQLTSAGPPWTPYRAERRSE